MAEFRIAVTMDIVGTGATEAEAQAAAGGQYVGMVQAFCGSYGFDGDVMDAATGQPTAEAVLFTRGRINAYISDVVVGWKRREALALAAAAVDSSGVVMQ